MNATQRQEVERKIVRHLIRTMKANGWLVLRVADGGEPDEDTMNPTEEKAMDAVFAVDEATIYFHKSFGPKRGMTHFAHIILGNDGYDCIADHSCAGTWANDDFERIMDEQITPYCEEIGSEYA